MLHITIENFDQEVAQAETPVILDFYADWCAPCQMMSPVFESLSEEYEGKLKFAKVDTQDQEMLAIRFGVQGIPNLVILNKGDVIGRIVGFAGESQLRTKIDSILDSNGN